MKPSQDELTNTVCSAVTRITESWNLEAAIGPETQLVQDLGFSSMEFIDLLATLETRLQHKLPYEKLMTTAEGTYRQELSVGELVNFVQENFDEVRPAAGVV